MIPERLEHLRAFLDAKGVDAVVINKYVNLHYFSGFRGDDTLLLVSRDRAFLVTDFRYTEQAATQAPLYEIVEQKHGLLQKAAECVLKAGWKKVAFEGNALLYDDFARLAGLLKDIDFTYALNLSGLRVI